MFRTEFSGKGMQRFGNLSPGPNFPPMMESLKNKILHAELPMVGKYILMASDAPKELGFEVTMGNNMHIQLELESREETIRIFSELSENGHISMPLQDMFWRAYFGSFRDKFNINWMVSYTKKD